MGCTRILEKIDARGAVHARAWHLHLDPKPRSAAAARRFVVGCLGPLDEDTEGALKLLTSEVVTNAILHARTSLRLGVAQVRDRIVVCVEDRNVGRPEQQPYSGERTAGRGIVILEALADHWGIAAEQRGKAVWFTMRLTAALPR
jgi:anti-sigma regulatory factor (Ser/Thr protein kinase)